MSGVNRDDILFVGLWHNPERRHVEMSVSATEQFLGGGLTSLWVFAKEESSEYSVTQPALFEGKVVAPKLGDLLEKLRRFVTASAELAAAERGGLAS